MSDPVETIETMPSMDGAVARFRKAVMDLIIQELQIRVEDSSDPSYENKLLREKIQNLKTQCLHNNDEWLDFVFEIVESHKVQREKAYTRKRKLKELKFHFQEKNKKNRKKIVQLRSEINGLFEQLKKN
jgi:hypothetical protein